MRHPLTINSNRTRDNFEPYLSLKKNRSYFSINITARLNQEMAERKRDITEKCNLKTGPGYYTAFQRYAPSLKPINFHTPKSINNIIIYG